MNTIQYFDYRYNRKKIENKILEVNNLRLLREDERSHNYSSFYLRDYNDPKYIDVCNSSGFLEQSGFMISLKGYVAKSSDSIMEITFSQNDVFELIQDSDCPVGTSGNSYISHIYITKFSSPYNITSEDFDDKKGYFFDTYMYYTYEEMYLKIQLDRLEDYNIYFLMNYYFVSNGYMPEGCNDCYKANYIFKMLSRDKIKFN